MVLRSDQKVVRVNNTNFLTKKFVVRRYSQGERVSRSQMKRPSVSSVTKGRDVLVHAPSVCYSRPKERGKGEGGLSCPFTTILCLDIIVVQKGGPEGN